MATEFKKFKVFFRNSERPFLQAKVVEAENALQAFMAVQRFKQAEVERVFDLDKYRQIQIKGEVSMSGSPPTSNRQMAIMLILLAILLPLNVVACNHKSDESYAYGRQQTIKWRAEQTYISPADKVVIDLRQPQPKGNQK